MPLSSLHWSTRPSGPTLEKQKERQVEGEEEEVKVIRGRSAQRWFGGGSSSCDNVVVSWAVGLGKEEDGYKVHARRRERRAFGFINI